ncbi:ATP-dependent zinc metalloprotease FtsH [Candidatus Dependentiae bacterium]|nr:ATP-dependent zinc metalloprotease FtsH [Candidatus Dependentiae bacterium]MCC7415117.1 ATP-dependent zinc metalloprotease FtsH [Campylobacterota bacterium]
MKRKNQKNSFFQDGPKGLVVAVVLFVVCMIALQKLVEFTGEIKSLSYTEFQKQVTSDLVKSIVVTGQDVQGSLRDGGHFHTVIPQNAQDWSMLNEHGVNVTVADTTGQMSLLYIVMIALFFIGLAVLYFFRQARNAQNGGGGGANIFNMGKSRAKMFMPSSIKENFDSVAGAAEAKEELKDIVDFLKNPEKYRRLGAQMTRGVLLVGEPGNGKTLLAKAVAGEATCPFFSISGSDFIEVFVGVGASRVRDLFAQARKHAPSIIFIDEIDAVGRHRGNSHGGGSDEREQTLNQLLTEMDGFQTGGGSVIVIAATNRPDVLDKALLRPGRFDRRVVVPYPDLKSREEILKVHARDVKLSPEVDLAKIARGTPGFSGADLKNIINEAAINASKANQEMITVKDFEEARDRIMLGKEIKTMTQSKQELELTAYHESGHALVALMLPEHSDPLHKITIIPRGRALGVTHSLPEREKYTQTREELLAKIKMSLGGRAAEQLVFNKVTTGAYSDFVSATDIARTMVCSYGMSTMGPVIYNQGGSFEYSQKTAERIDAEVQRILDECAQETMQLLIENRDKLNLLATTLLEKETLFAGEIYELLGIAAREEHKFA